MIRPEQEALEAAGAESQALGGLMVLDVSLSHSLLFERLANHRDWPRAGKGAAEWPRKTTRPRAS